MKTDNRLRSSKESLSTFFMFTYRGAETAHGRVFRFSQGCLSTLFPSDHLLWELEDLISIPW